MEDSSDSEAENASEDEAAESTETQGGGMTERLVVGLLARRRADDEGAGSDRLRSTSGRATLSATDGPRRPASITG